MPRYISLYEMKSETISKWDKLVRQGNTKIVTLSHSVADPPSRKMSDSWFEMVSYDNELGEKASRKDLKRAKNLKLKTSMLAGLQTSCGDMNTHIREHCIIVDGGNTHSYYHRGKARSIVRSLLSPVCTVFRLIVARFGCYEEGSRTAETLCS